METKCCKGKHTQCHGTEKPADEFYKTNQGYLDSICKKCRIKEKAAYAAKKLRATRPLRKPGRKPHYDKPVSEAVNNLFKSTLVI